MRAAFGEWLRANYPNANTQNTQLAQANRLEAHYGNLDEAYDADGLAAIRESLIYSAEDDREDRANPARFTIDGNLYQNLASYRATLGYYARFRQAEASSLTIDRDLLERLKASFLAHCTDFRDFQQTEGVYWREEREYKDALIAAAQVAIADENLSDEGLGIQMLEIMRRPPSNFINWRAYGLFWNDNAEGRASVARAIGAMLRQGEDPARAASEAAQALHPTLSAAAGRPTFGHERSLTTTAMALAFPANALAVKTRYLQRLARELTGRKMFRNEVMSAEEYGRVLAFADAVFVIMRNQWNWAPRDLWDVQGFFWVVGEHDAGASDDEEEGLVVTIPKRVGAAPTNLILYGPPGTGKTYATAERAVELCDGRLPEGGREALMKRYAELLERRRIAFVTFHQSYAYEDFVEGLRPEQSGDEDAGSGAGFSLRPRPGIFRQIAELARDNRGPSARVELDRTRQVFKMSLGRNDQEEGASLFKSAIDGGYIVLGYGGEVDWSAPAYEQLDAIRAKWQEVQPGTSGMALLHKLRAGMQVGDYVVVSDGLKRFRAVGVIEGPYYFEPGEIREYNHRRKVRWLWHNADGRPQELVYARNFQRAALYQLDSDAIHWSALEQIIAGATDAVGEPEPYVLIIDEINRANISKVFGELITLIEPDKRIGRTNEVSVTLPYSGERFGVPSNLHIIGAMNTADRSIALLDTALRRRFDFDELMPKPELLGDATQRCGIDLVEALKGLNERIEYLFDREHQIGHAFFMDCASKGDVDQVMRRKVIPLLAEYFYEDWEKIRQVLGETKNEGAFIRRVALRPPPGVEQTGDERWRYQVRGDFDLEAYAQLKA